MKILVIGIPKTGTTFLFYLLKNSLSLEYEEFFEPIHHEDWARMKKNSKNTLVKELFVIDKEIQYYQNLYSEFNKKIILIRDPRDRLISSFFFILINEEFYFDKNIQKTKLKISQIIEDKIRNPSIPFLTILGKLGFTEKQILHTRNIYIQYSKFINAFETCKIKYESLIDENFKSLRNYVGIDITREKVVAREHPHVSRTNSHGDWRSWFTPEDIFFFKELYSDLLVKFGYEDDWEISKKPIICRKNTIDYLEKWWKVV